MENVMMNSIHTQIKIVDFGLSNNYDPNAPLRTHCGSPEYAAPELFVPGSSYGPEVDLWSLGVILYGMVVGQLPFITIREENMSNQERRKKLLNQINKGYSIQQKKALALVTQDFRSLISRMLVTDILKRISMRELLCHAWVTERAKKSIEINPLQPLNENWQISIMKQVGTLMRLDWSIVHYFLSLEPQGGLAGMYNILAFKLQRQRLEGDGVSKSTTPTNIPTCVTPCTLPSPPEKNGVIQYSDKPTRKRTDRVKSPSAHKIVKDNTNPQTVASIKRPATTEKRPVTAATTIVKRSSLRTESAQPKVLEKRRLLSSNIPNIDITPDINHVGLQWNYYTGEIFAANLDMPSRLSSHPVPTKPTCLSSNERPATAVQILNGLATSKPETPKGFKNELEVVGSNGIAKVLVGKKVPSRDKISPQQHVKRKESPRTTRLDCDTLNTVNSKSVPTTCSKRAVTATPTVNRSCTRRNRVIPIMGYASVPNQTPVTTRVKSHNRKVTTIVAPKYTSPAEKAAIPPLNVQMKKVTLVPSKTKQVERSMKNEPIARSIAGFIANNMPTKETQKRKKN